MSPTDLKSSRMLAAFVAAMVVLTLAGAAIPAQAQTPTVIHTFEASGTPQNPYSWAIAQGRDGNLYSTTCATTGGTSVVFNTTTSGTLTVVHTTSPSCSYGVTLGTDGNFYGVTSSGGTDNVGEVYKVTPAGVVTVLHSFTAGADGSVPIAPPIEGTNGIFYGTTTSITVPNSTAYSVTSAGVFKTLHTFTGTDGQNVYGELVQGTDGNFYGATAAGGTSNDGVIFKMTPTGTVTVLHNFAGTNGAVAYWGLIQGTDGNFYGTTNQGGASGAGVVFKITSSGTYTVLHNFTGSAGGNLPRSSLVQATNGTLYGVTSYLSGPFNFGTIYSITTSGVFTTLYSFPNQSTNGGQPSSPLRQHTNGLLYGTSYIGGDLSCPSVENDGENVEVVGCGTIYSMNIGAKPFVALSPTSGKVGTKVGIMGQGFDSASVVKFGGVKATSVTLLGTNYITATVPAGAIDGKVTVSTGTTTLTSTQTFIVHNSWSIGKAMPTGTARSSAAVLGGQIYVIGGLNESGTVISNVQIYNPTTNTWSTGTELPTVTQNSSAAVVNNILYLFGGDNGVTTPTNAVWAYNPSTKKWTSKAAMPTARNGTLAVMENNIVYVMGGNLGGGANFVATVESYDPATDTWKMEASMDGAKDFPGGGLIGTTIVAADGSPSGSEVTGDTEGYGAATNKWTELTADPTARTGPCSGAIGSTLYDASGYINNGGAATTVNESFSLSAKWTTTLLPIPQGTIYPASAVANGQLYCFGGSAVVNQKAVNNVQIYQP
jgi:uncharacterized repeat protein (TIGR03803 family)